MTVLSQHIHDRTPRTHGRPLTDSPGGRLARLDVVLFGERLPAKKMRASIDAARHADVWMAIGTSGTVFPAAGLIDHCRPDTLRALVNAQPWTDSTATFDQETLDNAATVLADVLHDLHTPAVRQREQPQRGECQKPA
ncbi:Sir2 family NAD-dependent protein deacetylase [Streptomyces sp. MS19]|uniref:Sir2 family NAD-dependent protein deacetylase n=1 Tax=Streptomyces sp. MS19 TaxID=3385972 RepID=UPI0039A0D01F